MGAAVAAVSISACSGHTLNETAPTRAPSSQHAVRNTSVQAASFKDTIKLGGGDRSSQRFCAVAPAAGTIAYLVHGDRARLLVGMRGLKARRRLVGTAWAPGGDHAGEIIGSVRIDRNGRTQQPKVRFFHTPYYQRPGKSILLVTNSDRVIARTKPCGR
jgi:hypothetical protein